MVDTNVARVLSRAVAGRRLAPGEAQVLADRLVPSGQSWAYNQTLFDIGATALPAVGPRLRLGARSWPSAHGPPTVGRRPIPLSAPSDNRRFDGSDRQGRGRLVDALRRGPLGSSELAVASGRVGPSRTGRAGRVADGLVADGLADWSDDQLCGCP